MKLLNDLSIEEKRMLVNEILNKDETGSEWSQITDMFQLSLSPETIRKAGVGVRLASEVFSNSNEESSNYIERQKIRDLTGKVNAMYRMESRSELLRESVIEAVKNLKPFDKREHANISFDHIETGKELVLCIGDTHFGAKIDCRGLYGESLNIFNEEVFIDRMNRLYEETISILRKEDIGKMRLYMVGDLIDGILRQSQLTRIEFGLVDQVIRFSEFMAGWIDDISQYVDISVCGVSGNHSEIRPLNSKHREFEEENLEKIIYWYMAERLRGNESVSIDGSCDRLRVDDVLGYNFLLLHGDGEKKIEDISRSAVNLYGNSIDFFVCGHLHRGSEFPAGITPDGNSEVIRVPSVCGMDLYAQGKGYGGRAGAVAMVIEEGYGCRCKYPIKLS